MTLPRAEDHPSTSVRTDASIRTEIRDLVGSLAYLAAIATLIGIVAGLATTWLIVIINQALHQSDRLDGAFKLKFFALLLVGILGAAGSGMINSVVGQRMIASLRESIARKITQAPLEILETLKPHRILAILSNDIENVSVFTFNLSGYAAALAIVAGCMAYIARLSFTALLICIAATCISIALTFYSKSGWSRDYANVRGAQDLLQQQYRAITEGAKELRLSRERARQVHDHHLSQAVGSIARWKIAAMKRFWLISSVTGGIIFLAIFLLLMAHRKIGLSGEALTGTVLVVLYIRTPVEQLLNGLPAFFQAQIAFRRIARLSSGLGDGGDAPRIEGQPLSAPREAIEIENGIYRFANSGNVPGFQLGPIDLTIRSGETLFIVGENGSGKTTLVKVLLGLYRLHEGWLLCDGGAIGDPDFDSYRQMFSAIFSDYFLFQDFVSFDDHAYERAARHLADLEIAHKVDIADGGFNTTDLSTGQRKRLALIHAYLEGRPVLMFDEWAADQDPTFRRVFYETILLDLKSQGKTLIVVSHDDRFFDHADHIITLRDGRIVDERFAGSRAPLWDRQEALS